MQIEALDHLDRTTKVPRLRTRAQLVLLSAAQRLKSPQIAAIVRDSEATVGRWLKRYWAEGLNGLQDAPRPGRPSEVTAAYRTALLAAVRRQPRSLGLPFSLWTLQRLGDDLAEKTTIRVSDATVRRARKQAGIVLSRPQHKISRPAPDDQVKTRRLKIRATSGAPVMSCTTPTHSSAVGGPRCARCGAHKASTACFPPQGNRTSGMVWAPSTTIRATP
jgi:transposase